MKVREFSIPLDRSFELIMRERGAHVAPQTLPSLSRATKQPNE